MNLPILSYSMLNDYAICPRRCWHKWLAKDIEREAPSEAMLHGSEVHDALRLRLSNDKPLSDGYAIYEPLVHNIEHYMETATTRPLLFVEQKLGIKADGLPCDFFDPKVWLRGVLDVAIVNGDHAWMGDWKTGNSRYEDPKELQIHALLLKAHMPQITSVTGNYIWLKENRIGLAYDLSNTAYAFDWIKSTAETMNENMRLKTTPGPLCKWCPVPKSKCRHKK